MASRDPISAPTPDIHQTTKTSVLRSFVQRRQPLPGNSHPSSDTETPQQSSTLSTDAMAAGQFSKNNPGALGELQHNQQEPAPRSPRKPHDGHQDDVRGRSRSPTKNALSKVTLKSTAGKETSKMAKSRDASPTKPKKQKSGPNLASLLSRPKSLRNLYKTAVDDGARECKDKENRTPEQSVNNAMPPPIFAQFTSQDERVSVDAARTAAGQGSSNTNAMSRPAIKERPKSFQVGSDPHHKVDASVPNPGPKLSQDARSAGKNNRSKVFGAFPSFGHARSKSAMACPILRPAEPGLNPEDIDEHLEAMLNRRNIPENQRYKMRNLNNTIKMEFIRQDWAEMQAAGGTRPMDKVNSVEATTAIASGSDCEEEKPKRTRGKSFTNTFSRGKKEGTSPSKKQKGEGTLGRHFRSKSAESLHSERPPSAGSSSTNLLAKIKLQQGPAEYVAYLRKVQRPQLVEVGKLHKLRLLLRNETVAWIEDFIHQGGMKEIVGLLKRITAVEWREEHEDVLLHENLLCLKALSTTARGMQYLDSIQAELFPKLLQMLFDPEKKGPSEFTTRNTITSVIFAYIASAAPVERVSRVKSVLEHLRDPAPKEDEQPLPFVLEMRRDRPYRVWCKEMVSVTKEVFWIFLHNLNVDEEPHAYMLRHFPNERPPVPAAPYVGGVEWDATNYLASHLDLMNALLACTPSCQERNALRAALRISGWERFLGGSIRLCKEKFYGSVHDGLRTWVAAAADDGWDVRDVRYGPPPASLGSPKKAGGGQKKEEAAPRIAMPKLDFELDRQRSPNDAWL